MVSEAVAGLAYMDKGAVENAGVGAIGELAPAEVLSAFEAVLEIEGVVGVVGEGEGFYRGYFAFPCLPRLGLFRGLCL